MFNVAFLSTAFLAAIGTLGGTFALPNSVSPDTAIEFAPGPGLPTLEDLGVTVADLMSTPRLSPKADQNNTARDLSKRYDNKCYPTSQAWFMYISRDPIYLCARYLEELGNQACVVPQGNWVTFCAAGAGLIRGIGVNRQQTQSTCWEVAQGAWWIYDNCYYENKIAGDAAAQNNGDLVVHISAMADI